VTVTEEEAFACAECGSGELVRDQDVLDTWFSSALWPFATLGWPDDTADLRRFYPGDFNITAREIIRLWENRMIFSGLEFMGEVPFRDVVIYSTVLAADGRRMSKSLGTGIDPLETIARFGADATRYGLAKMSSAQDVRFSEGAIEEGRKLTIKLWNVARLLLSAAGGAQAELRPKATEERWMLARLDATVAEVEERLQEFDYAHAVAALYHLTFDDFCDWYAEAAKPRLYAGDADAQATALALLDRLLRLLHPFMPHVTEEIWTNLPARESRLIVAPWPEPAPEPEAEGALERVQLAAEMFRRSGVLVELSDDERRIFDAVVKPGHVDEDGNREAEVDRLLKEIARAEGMLANERFVERAPADVVEAERDKLARYRRELSALTG
jgi:valyl-tRNA synthetase